MNIFDTIIYEPIFNTLLYVQKVLPTHDLGLAIIIVTLLIKVVLYLPSLSAIRSSRQLQSLQPKLKAIQEQYKGDKEGLAKAQMGLYKDSRVNPFSACLPTLIQLPVLYGLYRVFFDGLHTDGQGLLIQQQLEHVYPALRGYFDTTAINTTLFGWINLANTHNIPLAVIAGLTQFWQARMLAAPKEPKTPEARDEATSSAMNRQMAYIFPFLSAYFAYILPAGLGLYWAVSTLFTVGQQYLFLRNHPLAGGKKNPPADVSAQPA